MANLAETIKEITRNHLEKQNGLLLGQSVTAVGWINNTVPDCKNIVELPMADVAGAYFAVGAALTGRRPILVIRFQDFMWLNGSAIVNYAAKTKELSGKGTPIFVRALAQEGHGTGALHSGVFHSLFMHMPGIRVFAPMTPMEYLTTWDVFMRNDDPLFCSEHRSSFTNENEMPTFIHHPSENVDITIYGISAARFNLMKAKEILNQRGISVNIIHIFRLKPLDAPRMLLMKSKAGLVVDSGFETCGAAESIAYQLMYMTGKPVYALGRKDKTVLVCPGKENITPSPQRIAEAAKETLEKVKG